jgi:hypothetical protein
VLVVEFLPVITNIYEAVSGLDREQVNASLRGVAAHPDVPTTTVAAQQIAQMQDRQDLQSRGPASDDLGERRILRTSPLTEVPFFCCPPE